ncbi:MAG: hypothetical protein CMH98_02230 [Oceanospirillaceae bacterium]|nr:hypothetical protein [Oceanospirillaceae bacterium]|tara:strand:- start:21956 stop:22531 length:576 start_codon:yes stop_codon:yes gene_type:complete
MTQQRHTLGAQPRPGDDVNWSQVSETLSMLALAVAQIDTSLQEGSQSVNQLTTNFTAMADNAQRLLGIASDSGDSIPLEIGTIARELQNEIQQAIIAFQFYDRLTQRLDHVGESLEKMGHLIADPAQRYQPRPWDGLQQEIKSNYTMEAERIMFEHIMAGHSVAEALEIYHHHFSQQDADDFGTNDDIELF